MCRILGEKCISAECMFKPRSCKDGTFNLGTQLETKGFTPKTIFKLASNIPRIVRIARNTGVAVRRACSRLGAAENPMLHDE